MLVSSIQHSDSVLWQIKLHYRLLQDNGYNSLCCTVYPYCLFYEHSSLSLTCPSIFWWPQVCFLYLWVCFCFVYRFILCHSLDFTYKWYQAVFVSKPDNSLLWAAVLCIIRRLVAYMASTHYLPGVPHPYLEQPKSTLDMAECPWGVLCPFLTFTENYWPI